MWSYVSALDLDHACDALGMPPGTPGLNPMDSKKRYVRDRLMRLPSAELADVARLAAEEYGDAELASLIGPRGVRGVHGELKNLVFAAHGAKPRIILRDAINNVIEIVEHADKCLIYDRPLDSGGLTWGQLKAWWTETSPDAGPDPAKSLFMRLRASVDSPVERMLFKTYGARYGADDADSLPALLPQVYLHYDPSTARELAEREGQALKRQRMDFLMLFADRSRVVIEVDGKHHYADGNTASPRRYAEMVSEDRRLRLTGYEVYRFGGSELSPDDPDAPRIVGDFFEQLIRRHG